MSWSSPVVVWSLVVSVYGLVGLWNARRSLRHIDEMMRMVGLPPETNLFFPRLLAALGAVLLWPIDFAAIVFHVARVVVGGRKILWSMVSGHHRVCAAAANLYDLLVVEVPKMGNEMDPVAFFMLCSHTAELGDCLREKGYDVCPFPSDLLRQDLDGAVDPEILRQALGHDLDGSGKVRPNAERKREE